MYKNFYNTLYERIDALESNGVTPKRVRLTYKMREDFIESMRGVFGNTLTPLSDVQKDKLTMCGIRILLSTEKEQEDEKGFVVDMLDFDPNNPTPNA